MDCDFWGLDLGSKVSSNPLRTREPGDGVTEVQIMQGKEDTGFHCWNRGRIFIGGWQKRHGERLEKVKPWGNVSSCFGIDREGLLERPNSRKVASWKGWNSPWLGSGECCLWFGGSCSLPPSLPQALTAAGSGPDDSWAGP